MKEITMITTCEITCIQKVSDEELQLLEANKDAIEGNICTFIKGDLGADNVKILNNQMFIRDLPNQPVTQ